MKALTDWLQSSEAFFQQLGWIGVLAFAGLMAVAGMAALPLSVFAIAAGAIFGFGRGFLAIQIGTTLCAALNFLVSRYVARGFMQRKIATHPKFSVIDQAIGREGWKLVALIRFIPVPFGLMNYLLGLTAIRFWPYLGASAVAISVGNLTFAWMGATAQAGLQAATGVRERQPIETVLLVVGLVAAFAALFYITKVARAAVARAGIDAT